MPNSQEERPGKSGHCPSIQERRNVRGGLSQTLDDKPCSKGQMKAWRHWLHYHTPSWVRAGAQKELPALGDFTIDNLVDYDGFVELRMPELSCFENAMNDPYYAEVVAPDEKSFWDIGRSKITVGWEETYVDATKDGAVDPSVKGQSGHNA